MAKISEKLVQQGLAALDYIIGNSELLMSVAPIRIMVTGGVMAVLHLHTRDTTEDLDFILDPNVDAAAEYREEFFMAIRTATDAVEGMPSGWLSDHMRVFIRSDKREELFLTSIEQNLVVFPGENLVAYACRHDWALESKLSRIEMLLVEKRSGKMDTDMADAVELVRLVKEGRGGRRVSGEDLRGLNFNSYKVQSLENAIAAVAQAYQAKYGEEGISL